VTPARGAPRAAAGLPGRQPHQRFTASRACISRS
jgi:hypothetical protein